MDYVPAPQSQPRDVSAERRTYYGSGLDNDSHMAEIQLKVDDIIGFVLSFLKGQITVGDETIESPNPLANDVGIYRIMSRLTSRFNRNTILSNLRYEDIKTICVTLRADLITDIAVNHDKYGVRTCTDAENIINTIDDMVFMACSRALTEGGTGKTLLAQSKIVTHTENVSSAQQGQGLFGGIFAKKRR